VALPRSTLPVIGLLALALLIGTACAPGRTGDRGPDAVAPGDGGAITPAPTSPQAAPRASPESSPQAPPEPSSPVTPKTTPKADPDPHAPLRLDGRTVALDPGHNGGNAAHPDVVNRLVDAGGFMKPCNTVGASTDDGYTESQLNLDIARLVQARLEARGARVLLTRESNDGVGPCIDERGRFGAAVGADLLVSIHADGAPAEEHGFHVITPAVVTGYTDGIVDSSAALARSLRDALVAVGLTPATYAGVEGIDVRGDLGTLNHSSIPAVIVESANLRNGEEAARLHTSGGRAQVADGIAMGITTFLTR
jgi:N-acetylmuramoyl-L-alanine amidase